MKRLLLVVFPLIVLLCAPVSAATVYATPFSTREALLRDWRLLDMRLLGYEAVHAERAGRAVWRLRADSGKRVLEGRGHTSAIPRQAGVLAVDNCAVSVSMKVLEGGGAGIVIGFQGDTRKETGYHVWLHPGRKNISLFAPRSDNGSLPGGQALAVFCHADLHYGVWHHLKLVTTESRFMVFWGRSRRRAHKIMDVPQDLLHPGRQAIAAGYVALHVDLTEDPGLARFADLRIYGQPAAAPQLTCRQEPRCDPEVELAQVVRPLAGGLAVLPTRRSAERVRSGHFLQRTPSETCEIWATNQVARSHGWFGDRGSRNPDFVEVCVGKHTFRYEKAHNVLAYLPSFSGHYTPSAFLLWQLDTGTIEPWRRDVVKDFSWSGHRRDAVRATWRYAPRAGGFRSEEFPPGAKEAALELDLDSTTGLVRRAAFRYRSDAGQWMLHRQVETVELNGAMPKDLGVITVPPGVQLRLTAEQQPGYGLRSWDLDLPSWIVGSPDYTPADPAAQKVIEALASAYRRLRSFRAAVSMVSTSARDPQGHRTGALMVCQRPETLPGEIAWPLMLRLEIYPQSQPRKGRIPELVALARDNHLRIYHALDARGPDHEYLDWLVPGTVAAGRQRLQEPRRYPGTALPAHLMVDHPRNFLNIAAARLVGEKRIDGTACHVVHMPQRGSCLKWWQGSEWMHPGPAYQPPEAQPRFESGLLLLYVGKKDALLRRLEVTEKWSGGEMRGLAEAYRRITTNRKCPDSLFREP